MAKLKLALYWSASCGGCDVAVLDLNEKILKVAEIEALAAEEGIELPAESFQPDVQPPPPLATIPTQQEPQAQPEPLDIEEGEVPELEPLDTLDEDLEMPELETADVGQDDTETADLDIPALQAPQEDLPDLDLDGLGSLEPEDQMPELAMEEPFADEEPPPAKSKKKPKKEKAGRKPKKEKPRRQPKPKAPRVRTSAPQGLSFGRWLAGGLREANLLAILVLILLLALFLAACVALVYGINLAADKFL